MNLDDAGTNPIPTGAVRSDTRPVDTDSDHNLRNVVEWIVIIAIAVGFAFVVRAYAFQTFYIPSESMVPRLKTDDRVLVNKLAYDIRDPHRGDVVVFKTPPGSHITDMSDLVKRIVGLPGETIQGRDGQIYIDGKVLPEPYLPADVKSKDFGPVKIPANSYFMLGDNRQYSNDSTVWGPANRDLFVGPVFAGIWPLDRLDVPGWVWGIPVALGLAGVVYLVVRRRED
ncbi:MAG: signal peptidase I [Acidimicrobiia bacterium]